MLYDLNNVLHYLKACYAISNALYMYDLKNVVHDLMIL